MGLTLPARERIVRKNMGECGLAASSCEVLTKSFHYNFKEKSHEKLKCQNRGRGVKEVVFLLLHSLRFLSLLRSLAC